MGRRVRAAAGAVLGLLLVAGLGPTGCSTSPPAALPDPAGGTYLTLEEQRSLSSEQLSLYCGMLDDYLVSLRRDLDLATALGDSLGGVIDSLTAVQTELNRETRRLTSEVNRLKQGRTSATEYTTQEGDTLMKLAAIFYDSNAEWRRIYNANREKIEDPGAPLPAGLRLTIPQ